MDEILADVEGYKGNPSYSVFYPSFMRQIPFVQPKDSTTCEQKSISLKIGKVFMFKANKPRHPLGYLAQKHYLCRKSIQQIYE